MKTRLLFLIAALCISLASAQQFPSRPQGPIADYARVLDQSAQQEIARLAQILWEQGNFALVVATVPSIGTTPIEEYAVKLYEHWGIGDKKQHEGVLFLLSLDPRRVRVEVGYGSEAYLNDAMAGRILDEYGIPSFRNGNFGEGIVAVSQAIALAVAKGKGVELTADIQIPDHHEPETKVSLFHLLFVLVLAGLLLGTAPGRSILLLLLISSMSGSRHGGGGGFGGGMSGRGFGGGFGGGMSGGGGASRSF